MSNSQHASLINSITHVLGVSNYQLLKSNAVRAVWKANYNQEVVIIKTWANQINKNFVPLLAHRALNDFRNKLKHTIVPEHLTDGFIEGLGHYVVMRKLDGVQYPWDWNSITNGGGRALRTNDVIDAITTLQDLQTTIKIVKNLSFPQISRNEIRIKALKTFEHLYQETLIDNNDCSKITEIFDLWSNKPRQYLAFSNTDFRFANMLKSTCGRVCLVDWDDARLGDFELEHAVAHCWIFLWNNPELQEFLISYSVQHLNVERQQIMAMILFRASLQLWMSKALPDRMLIHRGQIRDTLRTF